MSRIFARRVFDPPQTLDDSIRGVTPKLK